MTLSNNFTYLHNIYHQCEFVDVLDSQTVCDMLLTLESIRLYVLESSTVCQGCYHQCESVHMSLDSLTLCDVL